MGHLWDGLCAAYDELQRVSSGDDAVVALLDMSSKHIEAAESVEVDPAGVHALAYDAARTASTTVLAHQGVRPTTRGGHIVVIEAVRGPASRRARPEITRSAAPPP